MAVFRHVFRSDDSVPSKPAQVLAEDDDKGWGPIHVPNNLEFVYDNVCGSFIFSLVVNERMNKTTTDI